MYSFLSSALIMVAVASLPLSSCGEGSAKRDGFAITVTESGEVILTDEHVASYDWDKHQITLTPEGVARWQSFVNFNKSYDPPIRQVSALTTKEFSMTIDGTEMYRGHFLSMVSSLGVSGVTLYDTVGIPSDRVTIRFSRLGGEEMEDPRSRPEIEDYFQKEGKLHTDQ